ncbi:MAG TPA: hypothetical protein VNB90_04580 [Cytophagaceae bacterium]|jgi:hypothetical protein|nr:hypothetical protein [Cytophagaceae bacterium]
MRIKILILFLFLLAQAKATPILKQLPIIKAGASYSNGIPYSLSPDDTVTFRGITEIVLGPDTSSGSANDFSAMGYSSSHLGSFHAYLMPSLNFAELKTELDAGYYYTQDLIRFKYDEKYVDAGNLNIQIYDYQRTPMLTTQTFPIQNTGASFFELDLTAVTTINQKNLNLEENKYYVLEIRNAKGELYKLRIKYTPAL